jgi:flavin-dependent dehydrogenase
MNNQLLDRYDTAICGGGIAGLTLARQLRIQFPEQTVVLFDKLERPLPAAAFKVGESTVEPGGRYLADVLGLRRYLLDSHLEKFGFRFFFPDSRGNFADRPEVGRASYNPNVREFQLDRGVFENDLRQMVEDAGVTLVEGVSISDIHLSPDGSDHRVRLSHSDGTQRDVAAHWVVDAMGRRRYLQKKLGLTKDFDCRHSACWFRVEGLIDVESFVPASDVAWHQRIGKHPTDPRFGRWNSTMHLVDDGYWVWIIPLPNQITSVGIVTLEDVHPFERYNTYERALAWLHEFEPVVAAQTERARLLDFKTMRKYSYGSHKVLSSARWACTGEAGVFSDPYYANGMDLLGWSNTNICTAMRLEAAGRFSTELCDAFNREFLDFVDLNTRALQSNYAFFGNAGLQILKFTWDGIVFLALHGSYTYNYLFKYRYHEVLENPEAVDYLHKLYELQRVMTRCFSDWATRTKRGRLGTFQWVDYFGNFPLIAEVARRTITPTLDPDTPPKPDVLDDIRDNYRLCEDVAHAVFQLAVADVLPEALGQLPDPYWINVHAISLDPTRWQADGLFQPTTARRDVSRYVAQLTSVSSRDAAGDHPGAVASAAVAR